MSEIRRLSAGNNMVVLKGTHVMKVGKISNLETIQSLYLVLEDEQEHGGEMLPTCLWHLFRNLIPASTELPRAAKQCDMAPHFTMSALSDLSFQRVSCHTADIQQFLLAALITV